MDEQTNANANLAPRRQKIAIASEIIGAISFITCSFFLVGAISSLVLGIVALKRVKRQPEIYGGKTEAKMGITYSLLSLMALLIIAVIFLPNRLMSQHFAREVGALRDVQMINTAQLQYSIIKGHGKFTDLRTLGEEGLIDKVIASGQKGGYIFTSIPVENSGKPMYDTTARPTSTGFFGTANRSFYSNETAVVYDAEGGDPPTATPQNRIPQNGKAIE
jgi:competence protein ComGC